MVSFDNFLPLDIPLFIVQLFFIIPIYLLISYYRKTKIFDYLLFSGFFVTLLGMKCSEMLFVIEFPTPELWLFLTHFTRYLATFLLLLHAVRLKWEDIPLAIRFSLVILLILSIIAGLFVIPAFHYPLIRQIGIFISLLSCLAFILVYITIKPVIKDNRVRNAIILWVIVGCSWIVNAILEVGGMPFVQLWPAGIIIDNFEFFQLKSLITSLVVLFITVRYPEAVLISKPQIVRAVKLYKSILSLNSEQEAKLFGMSSLIDYISRIPEEYKKELGYI